MTEPRRTDAQNRKWRAMLTDISRCKPEGREYPPDTWQMLLFSAWDHERRFCDLQMIDGLEGRPPVPVNNYSTSILTVGDMAELITFALAYGDRHGVNWSGGDYERRLDPMMIECKHGTKLEGGDLCAECVMEKNAARMAGQTRYPPILGRVSRDPLMREAANRRTTR